MTSVQDFIQHILGESAPTMPTAVSGGGSKNRYMDLARRVVGDPKAGSTAPVSAAGGPILDRLIAAIRAKESSGNYDARGQPTRYGVARGAYQFLPSTYRNFATQIGVDPNDWSPQAQDRVARHAMSTYLQQFGNDPRKVAIAWYAGPGAVERSSRALNAGQSAGGQRMPSINDYADDILRRMGF